jgi:hypothetical protein
MSIGWDGLATGTEFSLFFGSAGFPIGLAFGVGGIAWKLLFKTSSFFFIAEEIVGPISRLGVLMNRSLFEGVERQRSLGGLLTFCFAANGNTKGFSSFGWLRIENFEM